MIDPKPADSVVDPACGTGGFLLAVHERAAQSASRHALEHADGRRRAILTAAFSGRFTGATSEVSGSDEIEELGGA